MKSSTLPLGLSGIASTSSKARAGRAVQSRWWSQPSTAAFSRYLNDRDSADPRVEALFSELLDEAMA